MTSNYTKFSIAPSVLRLDSNIKLKSSKLHVDWVRDLRSTLVQCQVLSQEITRYNLTRMHSLHLNYPNLLGELSFHLCNWIYLFYKLRYYSINDCSNIRLGKNIIANRMTVLNNLINLDWLNLSLIAFKLKVKELFLTNR